jgi:hypothetical protein
MVIFRKTEPEDILMLTVWIAADPPHRQIPTSFFTEYREGVATYVIEDTKGPVIFVRQEVEGENTRLHTQFPPTSRKRIVKALEEAYPLVAADAKRKGFKTVRFETHSVALARVMFAMGFKAEMIADL